MKRSKFSEHQVLGILKEVEKGRKVDEVCREHTISTSTYFNWKAKYGGMTPVGSNYFRLTTEFLGDGKSLEAVTYYQYFVEMVKTSDQDSGQLWTLIRTN